MLARILLGLLAALGIALPGVQHIYILHTNDIHGALLPSTAWWMSRDFPPPLSNAPGALTVIRELRAEADAKGYGFLLLDAGDVFKGTPIGDFTSGQAVVDYFNRAGYDAIGVGTHDFSLGLPVLKQLVDSSHMPWLCANIDIAVTAPRPGVSLGEPETELRLRAIHFDFGRFNVRPGDAEILKDNAGLLLEAASRGRAVVVTIEGYCDPVGNPEYNMALGLRRAEAAKTHLVKSGVKAEQLVTISYGEDKLVSDNPDEYETNRRCDFKLAQTDRGEESIPCLPSADSTSALLAPHLLLERGGVKIGVLGLIASYDSSAIRNKVVGDVEIKPEEAVAQQHIDELRRRGADIVIGLTHIGHKYEKKLADNVPGFDLIIGGRSNTVVDPPVETPENHTIVCQAASKLTAVGFLDLSVDTETGRIIGYEGRLINLYGDEIPKDLAYLAYLDSIREIAERGFDEVIGTSVRRLTRADLRESPAGNLVTDAMRDYAGADIALHNSTGIRSDIPEGELTYRTAYQIDAFGNTLVTGEYTGNQVREMLELAVSGRYSIFQVSGVRMTCRPDNPLGSRLQSALIGGNPLEPDRTYRVVTNSYIGGTEGRHAVFRLGQNVEDTQVPLRDAIADYFRRHSPVDARIEGRITLLD